MKKVFILFFSLVMSNTLNINLNSSLELDGQKIIDRNLNDLETPLPLQNFLIELKENQNFSLSAEIVSKKVIENKELLYEDNIEDILNNYNRYNIETSGNEIVTYFISEPMYMRGIRIVQIAVLPYFYDSNNGNITLYEDISLTLNFGESDGVSVYDTSGNSDRGIVIGDYALDKIDKDIQRDISEALSTIDIMATFKKATSQGFCGIVLFETKYPEHSKLIVKKVKQSIEILHKE